MLPTVSSPRGSGLQTKAHPLAEKSVQFKEDSWMLMGKNPPANAGDIRDVDLTPGSEKSLGGGQSNPFQYSCLENPHGQRSLAGDSP